MVGVGDLVDGFAFAVETHELRIVPSAHHVGHDPRLVDDRPHVFDRRGQPRHVVTDNVDRYVRHGPLSSSGRRAPLGAKRFPVSLVGRWRLVLESLTSTLLQRLAQRTVRLRARVWELELFVKG